MAQNYGAAQGIVDLFTNAANKGEKYLNMVPTPQRKVDTSWHDQKVRQANQSFQDAAKKSSAPKPKATPLAKPGSFKKGGDVKKTGMAKVHKGEKVLTAKQVQAAKKKSK